MVMTSGIQMSNPVMKYFFTVLQTKKARRRAGPARLMAER
jgi:hypothetical protein